jgi:hypothetical protein
MVTKTREGQLILTRDYDKRNKNNGYHPQGIGNKISHPRK